jgi:hypothetical protein
MMVHHCAVRALVSAWTVHVVRMDATQLSSPSLETSVWTLPSTAMPTVFHCEHLFIIAKDPLVLNANISNWTYWPHFVYTPTRDAGSSVPIYLAIGDQKIQDQVSVASNSSGGHPWDGEDLSFRKKFIEM